MHHHLHAKQRIRQSPRRSLARERREARLRAQRQVCVDARGGVGDGVAFREEGGRGHRWDES